jgi:hypothetical protein
MTKHVRGDAAAMCGRLRDKEPLGSTARSCRFRNESAGVPSMRQRSEPKCRSTSARRSMHGVAWQFPSTEGNFSTCHPCRGDEHGRTNQREASDPASGTACGEDQEQAERVAIGFDRKRPQPFLGFKVVLDVRVNDLAQRTCGDVSTPRSFSPANRSNCRLACARSSGVPIPVQQRADRE